MNILIAMGIMKYVNQLLEKFGPLVVLTSLNSVIKYLSIPGEATVLLIGFDLCITFCVRLSNSANFSQAYIVLLCTSALWCKLLVYELYCNFILLDLFSVNLRNNH